MADENNDPAEKPAAPEGAPPEVESEIVAQDQEADETETLTAEAPPSGEDPAGPEDATPGKSALKGRLLVPGALGLVAVLVIGAVALGLLRPWDNGPSTPNAPGEAAATAQESPVLSAPLDAGQAAQEAPPQQSAAAPLQTDKDIAAASDAENAAPPPPANAPSAPSAPSANDADSAPDAPGAPDADEPSSARPVPDKIANDVAALKAELRRQSAAFDQALGEERGRTEALEQDMAAMRRELKAALAARAESAESAEAEIETLRAAVEKISNEGGLAASRRAAAGLALNNLQMAVKAGRPFEAEFETLARLAPNAPQLVPLGRYAAQGAPSIDQLRAQFPDAARAGLAAAGREKAGGFLARLLARAQSLISVRPAAPQAGDSPRAAISRAEAAVVRGDAAGALREIDALSPETQAAMSAWRDMARAHVAAEQALAALRAAFLAPEQE